MKKLAIFIVIFLTYNSFTISMENKPYHHLPDGTFRNPEGSPERNKNFNWSFKKFRQEKKNLDMTVPSDHVVEKSNVIKEFNSLKNDDYIGWIGHATFLIKLGETTIITDPVFSKNAGPLIFGPKRFTEPALNLDELPEIKLLENGVSEDTIKSIEKWQRSDSIQSIFLLENIRFHKEETKQCDCLELDKFTKLYKQLGNVFVNDAFGCCHRDHVSITCYKDLNRAYGFLIEKEINVLKSITRNINNDKILSIVGGAKIDDKLLMIKNLSHKIDGIYIAGGNINSIYKNEKYKNYLAHLGAVSAAEGDIVKITSIRPISKMKRWLVSKVLKESVNIG